MTLIVDSKSQSRRISSGFPRLRFFRYRRLRYDHTITEYQTMSFRKISPKGQGIKNRKGRLTEKSTSFHGAASEDMVAKLCRPRTVPDLISGRSAVVTVTEPLMRPKLTKLLINVTVQRSLGPVHVLMSPESTVGELIAAAIRRYSKEGRRPVFQDMDCSRFDLHYSQFSLESLSPDAKLSELGSRNFFLCPKQSVAVVNGETGGGYGGMTASSTCSKEAEKVATKGGAVWLRFMEFML